MSKIYIIEKPDGSETAITPSLEGYEGWTTVGEADREPLEDEEWSKSKKSWTLNTEKKAKKEKFAKSRDPMKLLAMIEDLEARLAKLEERKP